MRIPGAFLAFAVATSASAEGLRAPEVSIRPVARGGAEMTTLVTSNIAFDRWLAGFRERAIAQGIRPDVVDAAFTGIRYNTDVIEKDRNQSEFTKQIWDYLDSAASEDRVRNGRAALQANAALLAQIERRYGVEAEVVTAIWGLESAYGTYRGSTPIIEALATLAYDGRRGPFFEQQLIAALRIAQDGRREPARHDRQLGRGHGAHPVHPHLLPRPCAGFRRRRAARHLVGRPGRRARLHRRLPRRIRLDEGPTLGRGGPPAGGLRLFPDRRAHQEIPRRLGREGRPRHDGNRVPNHGQASILLPAGARGAAFMIFDNFHVIERYNTADAYVIGVGHLSDRIRGAGPLRSGWPREDRNLTVRRKAGDAGPPHAGRVRHARRGRRDRPQHHRRDPRLPEDAKG